MHRLRGNMLSLDEDMYREGMKIVDEMRDGYEADDGTTGDGDYDKLGCRDNGHEGTAQSSTKHARHTQLLPLTSTQSRARKAPFLKRSPR